VIVRRRIGTERQLILLLGGIAQVVENQARLHACEPGAGIDVEQAVQVLGEVDHHCDVAALAGEARRTAAREHRRLVLAADAHRLDDVVDRARDDDADRQLPVVGAAGGVHGAVAVRESDLRLGRSPQLVLERAHVDGDGANRRRRSAGLRLGRHLEQVTAVRAALHLSSSP